MNLFDISKESDRFPVGSANLRTFLMNIGDFTYICIVRNNAEIVATLANFPDALVIENFRRIKVYPK